MFGEMVGGKGYTFGQEKDWMGRLEEDLKKFVIKSEGWCEVTGRRHRVSPCKYLPIKLVLVVTHFLPSSDVVEKQLY